MRDLILLFVYVVTILIRLVRPGGVRAVLAESVLLRHQLLILNRSRHRTPNLRPSDRLIAGLCAILVGPSKILASVFRKTRNEAGTERPTLGSDSCRC
jgi:hypothetical protein